MSTNIAWGKKLKGPEKQEVLEVSQILGISPDWLMTCMAFETGETFSPSIKNAAGSSACVDTDTEILTKQGWASWDALSIGDAIFSFNKHTQKIEHDNILDIITKISDNNYSISCRSFDSVTTHDHDWYLRKKYYNRVDVTEDLTKLTTEEIINLKSSHLYSFLHPCKDYVGTSPKISKKRKYLLILIGMICGDGSINKERGRIELVQSSKATPKRVKTVTHILSTIFPEGVSVDARKGKELIRWRFNTKQSRYLLSFFDTVWNSLNSIQRFVKKLNPDLLSELSPQEAKSLMCGYLFTDGHFCKSNKTISFRNTEKVIIDDFMHLAVLCGKNPRMVSVTKRDGTQHIFPNGKSYYCKDIYTVYLRRFKYTSANVRQLKIEHKNKKQLMWCPTTNNGTWIARRRGTVYITGNCGLLQFIAPTAISLGTTLAALAKMSFIEQMDYVEKYLRPYKSKMKSIDDVYMAILWPKAVGKPDDYVLFDSTNTKQYKAFIQNKGLDINKDGKIIKAEVCKKIRKMLDKGLSPEFYG